MLKSFINYLLVFIVIVSLVKYLGKIFALFSLKHNNSNTDNNSGTTSNNFEFTNNSEQQNKKSFEGDYVDFEEVK